MGERQPLLRPAQANQVWSMDFVFDRSAEGRVIRCLMIVDDATHEAVAIDVERAISGHGAARVLDRLAQSRGLPQVIRTDNGGKAMVVWVHARACSCGGSNQANRTGTPTSNPSTASYAMNASTSTGSRRCCARAPRSNAGDANTTRIDPRKQLAA
ncbi:transposase InsO family protein [Xanthomonas campestris]|nr:transposase InsO family protein [Xanthomonas cannabis]